MTREQVADYMKSELEAQGMSQAELARQLSVKEPRVSVVINGKRPPSKKFLDFFGLKRVCGYEFVKDVAV